MKEEYIDVIFTEKEEKSNMMDKINLSKMKDLLPKKNGLKVRIKQLEDIAAKRGLSEDELKELKELEDILYQRKKRVREAFSIDGKVFMAIGTVLAAGIAAAAKIYVADKITMFEEAGEIITSAAFKEV